MCPDIPSVTIPNKKDNITKSMVGPWPLNLHQDYLQHMYPMYFNASGVKTGVLHFQLVFSRFQQTVRGHRAEKK